MRIRFDQKFVNVPKIQRIKISSLYYFPLFSLPVNIVCLREEKGVKSGDTKGWSRGKGNSLRWGRETENFPLIHVVTANYEVIHIFQIE